MDIVSERDRRPPRAPADAPRRGGRVHFQDCTSRDQGGASQKAQHNSVQLPGSGDRSDKSRSVLWRLRAPFFASVAESLAAGSRSRRARPAHRDAAVRDPAGRAAPVRRLHRQALGPVRFRVPGPIELAERVEERGRKPSRPVAETAGVALGELDRQPGMSSRVLAEQLGFGQLGGNGGAVDRFWARAKRGWPAGARRSTSIVRPGPVSGGST
jgi:hypothetical protein